MPHRVAQRENRRQETYFCNDDYQGYLELMAVLCGQHKVEVWAYDEKLRH